jgi:hypothetical protein
MTPFFLFALFATPQAPPPCDKPHIQAHLDAVAVELAAADTSHLTPAQSDNRARHLAVLAEYRDACRFPSRFSVGGPGTSGEAGESGLDRLVTVFVDDDDVHCAVGHLMQQDGQRELVAAIRATRNTATIQELGQDPDVLAWLADAGLSPHEAARIQPSYCFQHRGGSCLCNDQYHMGPVFGVAEATLTSIASDNASAQASIVRVHGTGASPDDVVTVGVVDGDAVGRAILVVLRTEYGGTALEAVRGKTPVSDHVSCTSASTMDDAYYCAYVPTSVYVDALRSEDCLQTLGAYDPKLEESVCALDNRVCTSSGLPAKDRDEGCGAGTTPLGLALASLLLVGSRIGSRWSRRTLRNGALLRGSAARR